MDSPKFCIETKVERREDGLLITFYMQDGSIIEHYMPAMDVSGFAEQLKEQLPP